MGKGSITTGESSVDGFFEFINKRHLIWFKRSKGLPQPWTEDPILQKYKFTNVFRELDRGTLALRKMLEGHEEDRIGTVFNIWWYRLFNLDVHAENLGFVPATGRGMDLLRDYFLGREGKIFTSAHMTTGVGGEPKVITYLRAVEDAYDNAEALVDVCDAYHSMEAAFNAILPCYMVGRFVAYEIICDLRFRLLRFDPKDIFTWANMGPGAKRGLNRLGMNHETQDAGVKSMRTLFFEAAQHLASHVLQHYSQEEEPPFELREIEHSLCEFDKYERARLGDGRPRQLFHRKELP
jgi:hypothetical protein